MLPVNQVELRKVMTAWMDAHDIDADHPEALLQTNKMILALASEAANDPAAQNAEGAEWILFIVDEDGWVLNQQQEYLVPADIRKGKVLVRTRMVDGELVMEETSED